MTCRIARMTREQLPDSVTPQLLARLAAARGVTVVPARPGEIVPYTPARRGFWDWLLGRPAAARPAVLPGPREILRAIGSDGRDIWYCAPATAAELNALLRR